MDILSLTAVELGKKIKAKEISVGEATRAVLEQAKAVEAEINSYVTLDEDMLEPQVSLLLQLLPELLPSFQDVQVSWESAPLPEALNCEGCSRI